MTPGQGGWVHFIQGWDGYSERGASSLYVQAGIPLEAPSPRPHAQALLRSPAGAVRAVRVGGRPCQGSFEVGFRFPCPELREKLARRA